MIEKTAEEISMLMDDELDEHSRVRIIHKLRDDNEMKSCWEHYHLISDALRNNLPEIIYPDLANRIRNTLHQESNLQYPQHVYEQAAPSNRVFTGFALAASLAVIAVAGLLQISNQDESPVRQLATNQEEITIASEVTPAAELQDQTLASLPLPAQTVDLRIKQADTPPQVADTRLYDYLIHHNEYAVTMPVQGGMVPYARMVGYASDE